MLWWLARDHTNGAGPVDLWLPPYSGTDVLHGSPERAPTLVRRQAEILVEHGWSTGTSSLGVGRDLENDARNGGWRQVSN